MRINSPLKIIHNELNPIVERLSKCIDVRTVRNIKDTTVGIINARLFYCF